jgi:hypothetical protein
MSVRIDQLEPELAQKLVKPLRTILQDLRYAVPGQYQLRVSLLDSTGRKKRSDASAENWSPESGWIEIRFEPGTETGLPVAPPRTERESGSESLAIRLIRALDRAEKTPGWNFVSLKKFRDEILRCEPFPPGSFQPTEVRWQETIQSAIAKGLIVVGKVPNPKSPQFPVTSVRLNRLMPEVQEVLGLPKKDLGFHPIHIKGEPLSAIILRERR